MSGFAGILRERVVIERRTETRDALGASDEDWTVIDVVWASARPVGSGPDFVGGAGASFPMWRLTLRPCDIRVGDRVERVTNRIEVREVIVDPTLPDRVVAIGDELR
jgi:head-tail adaptor